MKYPTWQSDATRVGRAGVEAEHGQLTVLRPLAPLPIFLRNGHDANEELVRLIKPALEKRRPDVWFDRNETKSLCKNKFRCGGEILTF